MPTINIERCERIFTELDKKHRTTPILDEYGDDSMIRKYTASAREIEFELCEMRISGKISTDEFYYIFGMICRSALYLGGKDFYR